MLINIAAVDWLTLTTWEFDVAREWYLLQQARGKPVSDMKIMQYDGGLCDSIFVGQALQRGRKHWMLRVSGETAQDVYRSFFDQMVKCTRVDLQITLDLPADYSGRVLADDLREEFWKREADKPVPDPPNVRLWENTDNLDTVYVFSPQSPHYVRIYVKLAGDGVRYLRYEAEFKAGYGPTVWSRLELGHSLSDLLMFSVTKLPADSLGIIALFIDALGRHSINVRKPKRIRDGNTTLVWLRDAVAPALARLLNDHDTAFEAWSIMWSVLKNANPAYFNQDA